MRQLKFRIWDKQNRHWITENGYSLHCNSNWAICPFTGKLTDYVGMDGEFGEVYAASPATEYYLQDGKVTKEPRYVIMQYTCLKDSKGIEIYEGDIISGEFYDTEYHHTETIKHEVVFNNGAYNIASSNWHKPTLEIVGNIFENKKLLKQ
jgi:hypothetical protein